MKYLDLESTRILKVDEIYPYSLQCDACQQIFIREPAAISISYISIIKNRDRRNQNFLPLWNRILDSVSDIKWKDKSHTSQKIQK
jgi:hypothetical protein